MDISKLNETELKALWYDELSKKEQAEVNMQIINEQIIKLRNPQPGEVPKDEGQSADSAKPSEPTDGKADAEAPTSPVGN